MSLYVSKRYIVPGMYMYIHLSLINKIKTIFNNNVLNVYNHSSWVSQSNIINRFSTSSTPNSCTSKIIQLTSRIKSHQHLFSQNKKKNKWILVIALFITITVFLVGILVNPYWKHVTPLQFLIYVAHLHVLVYISTYVNL